jgi:hypothetical protein
LLGALLRFSPGSDESFDVALRTKDVEFVTLGKTFDDLGNLEMRKFSYNPFAALPAPSTRGTQKYEKVNFLSKNAQNNTISAVINFPQGFEENREICRSMQLYDMPKYADEAVSVLAPFFKPNL